MKLSASLIPEWFRTWFHRWYDKRHPDPEPKKYAGTSMGKVLSLMKECYANDLKEGLESTPFLLASLTGPPVDPAFHRRGRTDIEALLRCAGCFKQNMPRKCHIYLWRVYARIGQKRWTLYVPLCLACRKKHEARYWPSEDMTWDATGKRFTIPVDGLATTPPTSGSETEPTSGSSGGLSSTASCATRRSAHTKTARKAGARSRRTRVATSKRGRKVTKPVRGPGRSTIKGSPEDEK